MKSLYYHLRKHIEDDFNPLVYGSVFLFLSICIYINYLLDFEDSILDAYSGQPLHVLWKFLFFAFAYYSATLILWIAGRKIALSKPDFWFFSFFGLVLIAIDTGSPLAHKLYPLFPDELKYFAYKIIRNSSNVLTVFFPLFLFYKLKDQGDHFYGLGLKQIDVRPYFILLALMLPLIAWASFQPDFLSTYPSYPSTGASQYLDVPEWLSVAVFEMVYGLDFISVEILFRGFFIIGIARIIGKDALLPMVVAYAFLHFGKPLGETIGSIFGGYILGVVALYTNSIWGGIIVHLGIAWLMELAAFLQH